MLVFRISLLESLLLRHCGPRQRRGRFCMAGQTPVLIIFAGVEDIGGSAHVGACMEASLWRGVGVQLAQVSEASRSYTELGAMSVVIILLGAGPTLLKQCKYSVCYRILLHWQYYVTLLLFLTAVFFLCATRTCPAAARVPRTLTVSLAPAAMDEGCSPSPRPPPARRH